MAEKIGIGVYKKAERKASAKAKMSLKRALEKALSIKMRYDRYLGVYGYSFNNNKLYVRVAYDELSKRNYIMISFKVYTFNFDYDIEIYYYKVRDHYKAYLFINDIYDSVLSSSVSFDDIVLTINYLREILDRNDNIIYFDNDDDFIDFLYNLVY